ncbi:glycerophosphodiester phosphodiesterase [Streptomyces sp. URMC 123]|uniref:glycerophosphodiester phosphodiesterase n=1 Tax=Streptomyces sp. URMC 123 TaxID=3423403 RepID=UPI003F1DF43E
MPTRPAAAAVSALLGLCALFLLTESAQSADRRQRTLVIAHRGASAYAPENTLAAIDKADELGFAWVENDVQRTKDGVLVVIHDPTLARTTDVEQVFPDRAPWRVADFTAAEIAKLDAGSWFHPRFAGQRVLTLAQYLERVSRNGQKLLLEIKKPELYPGIERETLTVLREAGWLSSPHTRGRLVIQSFSLDSVRAVHTLRPEVKTGYLGAPAVADLPRYARVVDQINPPHASVTSSYVAAVRRLRGPHGKPLEVTAWTVDDGPTAARLAGRGVYGIITNKPDVVRDALEDRAAGTRPPAAAAAGRPGHTAAVAGRTLAA